MCKCAVCGQKCLARWLLGAQSAVGPWKVEMVLWLCAVESALKQCSQDAENMFPLIPGCPGLAENNVHRMQWSMVEIAWAVLIRKTWV